MQVNVQSGGQADRQTSKQVGRCADSRQTDEQAAIQMGQFVGRQTDRKMGRCEGRQTGRRTDRQTVGSI